MASTVASQSFHLYITGHQKASFSLFISYFLFLIFLSSCSINKQIAKQANQSILTDSNFNAAHVGISIYDPSTNKYLYNYQGDKYFVPASNTKLFTCYAAMKHLGDSLVGAYIRHSKKVGVNFVPNADPTFLHPDFPRQPVWDILKKDSTIWLSIINWEDKPLGFGWSWDDYNDDYMAERSPFPIYANVVNFKRVNFIDYTINEKEYRAARNAKPTPFYFFDSSKEGNINRYPRTNFSMKRDRHQNVFSLIDGKQKFINQNIPFITNDGETAIRLLEDTLHKKVLFLGNYLMAKADEYKEVYSQPTDSLLKPMMHRSDNFFAEQSLLMVSNEMLGVMNDSKIIDSLLKTDLKDIPQKPRWVDGSGLSRYNNFTPQSFVALLTKMKNEFEWNRITTILPTGNEGTLAGLYKNYVNRIYAKTGTLSGQVALSGYIITNKNKTLIFSVLVNNHQTSASNIRKAVEKFLSSIIEKY